MKRATYHDICEKHMRLVRTELKEALTSYAMDTFSYIKTMKDFLDGLSKWMLMREMELNVLLDIKERAAGIELSVSHVTQSKVKMGLKFFPSVVERQRQELQEELAATLKTSLMGLEALGRFLDAVERLSVTAVNVALKTVQNIIIAAQGICPHLVQFKRDNAEFFSPKLQDVEVLAYQLDKYIKAVQKICGTMKKGPVREFNFVKPMVDIDEEISEDDVQKMLDNINLSTDNVCKCSFRQDEAFRMVFLFQEESCSSFMERFSEREPRMQQFLSDLEGNAVHLDQMNMGARISSVAGGSVGAVGGVLSIIGLALIPVTAGASLAFTMTGVGLGITRGVNSAVTTAAEIGVNHFQQKWASETFQKFMKDVKNIQDSLDSITSPPQKSDSNSNSDSNYNSDSLDLAVGVGKVLGKAGAVGKGIDSLVDGASAFKLLQSEEVLASAGKAVAEEGKALRNVPQVASELPDMGQAAARGPLALSRGARVGFIALKALFLGMDVFFIVKDSMNLARGSETKVSKIIRARSALWKSEMDSWKKIYELLEKGQVSFQKKQDILKTEFYPDIEITREKEIIWDKEKLTATGNKEGLTVEVNDQPPMCFTIALSIVKLLLKCNFC
uniref:Si:ch73-233k15.2 n=1 Tax=Neogobius melanostomus TaxID=47308 RepID=A0A8C6UPN6_9GOBI